MRLNLRGFLLDESGAATIEYGLIAAGMSVALITLAGQLGDDIKIMVDRFRDMLLSFNLRFTF